MVGTSENDKWNAFGQGDLFETARSLKTLIIKRRADFEGLFAGFHKMLAVSYVVSPDLLLEFFDKRGYTDIELVVGNSISAGTDYKKALEQKDIEVTDRLASLVEKGSLRIFVPNRTIHTKMYLLEGESIVRVIQTSANLTETAQDARRQINYAWYIDFKEDDLLLGLLKKDYHSHREGCSLFMEDLKNLINRQPDIDRRQIIEVWLKGGAVSDQDIEEKRLFHELSGQLAQAADLKEEPVLVLGLPAVLEDRKKTEKLLAPLNPDYGQNNKANVNGSAYIRYVYENHRIPLLILHPERSGLLLGLDGTMRTITGPPSDPSAVNKGLEHIERYVGTVDSAQSTNRKFAKASMFEALLYIMFTPFANEYMKMKRARFGMIDARGPRFLYIYGPSQNGKSTFLRFALKVLTGSNIEPLSRQDFTRTRIMNAALLGTAFPLVFDDVDPSRTQGLEDVFKSYWERWWQEQYVSPQIVISSNTPRLKEWAKSRMKRVDFDVHFVPTEIDKERLNKLFSEENPIFRWFSFIYLNHLSKSELPSDDELKLARTVMKELYQYADRHLPEFFPNEPLEKLYDPGHRDWHDLIYTLHKAAANVEGNRIFVKFDRDFQPWEINDYQRYLPQTIKYQRKGSTLIIENPSEFQRWLGPPPRGRNIFSRMFGK